MEGPVVDNQLLGLGVMPKVLPSINLVHPILEPFRFLEQHGNQHHGGDRNGNDGIDDGKHDKVDQDLRF